MIQVILEAIGRIIVEVLFDLILEIPGLRWALSGGLAGLLAAVVAGIAFEDLPDSAALAIVLFSMAATAFWRWTVWRRATRPPPASWSP
ncbi:hypothetical protein [Azospirillum sp. sgz302134]